jgi:hypothetical protein
MMGTTKRPISELLHELKAMREEFRGTRRPPDELPEDGRHAMAVEQITAKLLAAAAVANMLVPDHCEREPEYSLMDLAELAKLAG